MKRNLKIPGFGNDKKSSDNPNSGTGAKGHAGDWNLGYRHAGDQEEMRRDYFSRSHRYFGRKRVPWGPLFIGYIGILLAAALLSGAVADSVQRRKAVQEALEQERAAQVSSEADADGADGSGGGTAGGGTGGSFGNAPSGQNTGQGNGQNTPRNNGQGGGQAGSGGDVTIGDTYYASDQQNLPADQPAPAEQPAATPPRIEVESISISSDTTWMRQGELVQLSAQIAPENATDPTLQWRSSNEGVAKVNAAGQVISVGGGPVIISAIASNGLKADFPMDVSTREKRMLMTVSRTGEYNDYVGDNWDYEYVINGTTVSDSEEMIVVLGDTINVSTIITENDDVPDVGVTQGSFTVDEMSFANGFEIQQEVFVEENEAEGAEEDPDADEDGYAGGEAAFLITYSFINEVE